MVFLHSLASFLLVDLISRNETERLVSGVSCCIFRGYDSVQDAHAAFEYARARSWLRLSDAMPTAAPIPALPRPIDYDASSNPLNGPETLDDFWFVVYRGICPGVYRSHLECQLNTLGVKGALHQSIEGKDAAVAKYLAAVGQGNVAVVSPPYEDPFL
ncbi:hypothetical protein B0H13DRAFT_1853648 [Mycena leptocephala]|nr:hypothetical protein B0H13DRAFT_1853648 [Mycena leptocephala]